eukprot:750381_1
MNGDLIPWVMSQQFQDDDFGKLSGIRIVRIATHPHIQSMGYGTKALNLLIKYFEGKLINIIEEEEEEEEPPKKKQKTIDNNNNLPVLLINVEKRKPKIFHWIGVSYGLTLKLFKFWKSNGFKPVYLRQIENE